MEYIYCYEIEWSQTDRQDVFIISTPELIANKLKAQFPGARYYNFVAKAPANSIIK